jgi:hypothetical protein
VSKKATIIAWVLTLGGAAAGGTIGKKYGDNNWITGAATLVGGAIGWGISKLINRKSGDKTEKAALKTLCSSKLPAKERYAAISKLGQLDTSKKAMKAMVELANDKKLDEASRVDLATNWIVALPDSAKVCRELLKSTNDEVAIRCAGRLAELSPPDKDAVKRLNDFLSSGNDDMKTRAACVLKSIKVNIDKADGVLEGVLDSTLKTNNRNLEGLALGALGTTNKKAYTRMQLRQRERMMAEAQQQRAS